MALSKVSPWSGKWAAQRRKAKDIMARGDVTVTFVPTAKYGRIHVVCPQTTEFKIGATQLSGHWRNRVKVWTFPPASHPLVLQLVRKCFPTAVVAEYGFREERQQ